MHKGRSLPGAPGVHNPGTTQSYSREGWGPAQRAAQAALGGSWPLAPPQVTLRTELVRTQRQTHRRFCSDLGGPQRAACDPALQTGGDQEAEPCGRLHGEADERRQAPGAQRLPPGPATTPAQTSALLSGSDLQGHLGYQPPGGTSEGGRGSLVPDTCA